MGLAISELDTLDATEHMALVQRCGTLRGGKRTCFRNGDAPCNIQCPPGLQQTICPQEKMTASEAILLDPTTDPSWAMGVEAN